MVVVVMMVTITIGDGDDSPDLEGENITVTIFVQPPVCFSSLFLVSKLLVAFHLIFALISTSCLQINLCCHRITNS